MVLTIKLYPRDQIKQYLLIDVIIIVSLVSTVLYSDSDLNLLEKILLLVLLLVSYYAALWFKDWRLLGAVLSGFLFITILSLYVGSIVLTFGFVFADLVGRAKSKWHIGTAIAAIALMFAIVLKYNQEHLINIKSSIVFPILIVQLLMPIIIYILEKTKNLEVELAETNNQLVQQEERQRIARDLHDTIGHTLTMIKLKTELTTKLVDKDPSKVKGELDDILATTRTAMKQVRELVSDMKFISLENELEHSNKLLKAAGIHFSLIKEQNPVLLSSVEETMISLCVRESMTNILKHSKAKRCNIHIEVMHQTYVLKVIDDGIGLAKQGGGNGIQSMKERMQALQGETSVDNVPIGGTMVTIKLPIHQ